MNKRSIDIKPCLTAPRPKKLRTKAKKNQNHRDANQINKSNSEVNAAGWSVIVNEVGKSMLKTLDFLKEKDEKMEELGSQLKLLLHAHNSARQLSIQSAGNLKSFATDVANSELSLIRRALKNGKDPNNLESIKATKPELISAYKNYILGRPMEIAAPTKVPAVINPVLPSTSVSQAIVISDVEEEGETEVVIEIVDEILPPPGNVADEDVCNYYSPYEACDLVTIYARNNRKRRANAIKIMTEKKFIPVNTKSFYKKLVLFKANKIAITNEWHSFGKPPKLADINKMVTDLITKHYATNGHCISVTKVKELITDAMLQQWLDGRKPENMFQSPCDTTLSRYASKIMADPRINLHRSVKNKTQTRFSAERSVRSTISYAMTVLASHYFEGKPIKNLHFLDTEKMSVGAKIAHDLVHEQNPGKQMIHALPGLITTTDAFTCFATTGVVNKEKELYITGSPPKDKLNGTDPSSSSRSNCTTERHGDRHKRGIRIEVHVTFNMLDHVAALYVVVYGLTEDELSGDEDIVEHSIKGLVSGSHQLTHCDAEGVLVLVRGKGGSENNTREESSNETSNENQSEALPMSQAPPCKEARVAQLYRDRIYYPYITDIRKHVYGWDGVSEVPNHLRAISWMDGANGQMKTITDEKSLNEDETFKLTQCKHSAARTGVEQSADVGPQFRSVHLFNRTVTFEDIPVEQNQLKRLVSEKLAGDKRINLPAFKQNAIIDFVTKLPVITHRAFDSSSLSSGFILNGQMDEDSRSIPNIYGMVNTLRDGWKMPEVSGIDRKNNREEYERQKYSSHLEHFRPLCNQFYKSARVNGHISEGEYDRYNYPLDVDSFGNIVRKDQGIVQENRQRAKIISHKKQRELRLKHWADRVEDRRRELEESYNEEMKHFKLNEECEAMLMAQLKETNSNESNLPSLKDLKKEHIGEKRVKDKFPSPELLKEFCKVRMDREILKNGKPKYPSTNLTRSKLVDKVLSLCHLLPMKPFYSQPPPN